MTNHLENARKLKNEYKVSEAAAEYAKAFAEDNKNIEAAGNSGLCYMMTGDLDKAYDYFNKANEIDKNDDLIDLYRCIIEVAQGKPFRKLTTKNDDLSISEQFMTAAEMLYHINLQPESFKLFEAVLSSVKDDTWLNLASNQYRVVAMLARFEFYDEAGKIAKALVVENPKAWHGHAALAQIELEQENIDDAKALFKQAMLLGGADEPLLITAIADTRLLKVSEKDKEKSKSK